MAYKAVNCPNCGAAITSIPDRGSFFCQYCGAKIVKDKTFIEVSGNVTVAGMASVASLLERGYLFLEDNDYEHADEYFERVLDADPECSKAYIGKLLVQKRCRNTNEFIRSYYYQIDRLELFQKALRFANDDEYDELMALKSENIRQHEMNLRNIQVNINQSTKQLNNFKPYFAAHKFTLAKFKTMAAVAGLLCGLAVCGVLFGVIGIAAAGSLGLIFVIPCGAAIFGTIIWRKDLKKKRAEGERLEKELQRLTTLVEQGHYAQRRVEEMWNGYDR